MPSSPGLQHYASGVDEFSFTPDSLDFYVPGGALYLHFEAFLKSEGYHWEGDAKGPAFGELGRTIQTLILNGQWQI